MTSENPYQSPLEKCGPTKTAGLFFGQGSLGWILFHFDGRISRKTFWLATIGINPLFIAGIAVYCTTTPGIPSNFGIIYYLLVVAMTLWTNFAIQAKRWHDRNKSTLWILVNLLPYAGLLWTFIELGFLKGTLGPNRFGAEPLSEAKEISP